MGDANYDSDESEVPSLLSESDSDTESDCDTEPEMLTANESHTQWWNHHTQHMRVHADEGWERSVQVISDIHHKQVQKHQIGAASRLQAAFRGWTSRRELSEKHMHSPKPLPCTAAQQQLLEDDAACTLR